MSRVVLVVSVLSALFIVLPWAIALSESLRLLWFEMARDYLTSYSLVALVAILLWYASPYGTLILLTLWMRNRLPHWRQA